ncbi:hypothetical protein ACFSTJ_07190 [Ottowia pentelensis]|uniref:ATP-binding protein n=1 Tax=Ottowia pentelensis TaxID=511108 RepID=UPI003625509D
MEHPVTECVTGLDLVEWQLRVAAGEPLPLPQDSIRCHGHAVEGRIYAEDPSDGFRPAPGSVDEVRWPTGVRVEAGVARGGAVPPYYDPMVAKLVAHADTREQALDSLRNGLGETVLLGLTTNIGYLRRVLADTAVSAATVHTRYLDEHGERFAQRGARAAPPHALQRRICPFPVPYLHGAALQRMGCWIGPAWIRAPRGGVPTCGLTGICNRWRSRPLFKADGGWRSATKFATYISPRLRTVSGKA